MRPNRLLVRSYLSRGARLWVVTRLAISAVFAMAEFNPAHLPLIASIQIVVLSVALGLFDIHRRREAALLGNLGIDSRTLVPMFAWPALAGEIGIQLVGAVTR